jgi:hypothetical protein
MASSSSSSSFFKKLHPRLQLALQLRQEGKNALSELCLACEEDKSGLAWFVKGEAYYGGGWGLLEDVALANICYEMSKHLGCEYGLVAYYLTSDVKLPVQDYHLTDPFALFLANCENRSYLDIACQNGNIFAFPYHHDYVSKAAEIGDAEGCFQVAEEKGDIRLCQKAAKQGHTRSMHMLQNAYLYGNYGMRIDYYKASKLTIKLQDFDTLNARFYRDMISPCELFNCGRYFFRKKEKFILESTFACLQMYSKVSTKVKSTVLCFLWMKLLTKDTRGVIARMVWKSRKNETELWV